MTETVGDLFCGAGGFSTGFEQAGFEIAWGIDEWSSALNSFRLNHSKAYCYLNDVRDIDGRDLPYVDIIIGSPPCQEFSKANQSPDPIKGLELIEEFIRIVKEIKPKYWILENVPPIMQYLPKYNKILPVKTILNSADFGLPQIRKRLFAGRFIIPQPTHCKNETLNLDGKLLRSWIGWGEALKLEFDDDIELIPNVGEKLHKEYKRNLGRKPHEPGQTLNTACPPRIYTADGRAKVRALTISEAQTLQGFPNDYQFTGDRMKQIGNSVPPPVGRALAECIMTAMTLISDTKKCRGIREEHDSGPPNHCEMCPYAFTAECDYQEDEAPGSPNAVGEGL